MVEQVSLCLLCVECSVEKGPFHWKAASGRVDRYAIAGPSIRHADLDDVSLENKDIDESVPWVFIHAAERAITNFLLSRHLFRAHHDTAQSHLA